MGRHHEESMSKGTTNKQLPEGHVVVPATAIGSLSILLVAGLSLLGVLDRLDLAVSKWVSHGGVETFPKALPDWLVWLASAIFAFGVSFAIVSIPSNWRRIMFLLTALVVVAGWAPVLSLAARSPDVAATWVATAWSGICALVYVRNHRMPCDGILKTTAIHSPDEAH